MTSDDYLTMDSVEGKPWDISIVEHAWFQVTDSKDDLQAASMLSGDTCELFDKLLIALDRDIQGFRDANRS
jgi:hypothetical protein